jgi:uncharacterized membrane protein YeiB
MEKITSYLIAVGLIGFGVWIVTAETRSDILAFGIAIGVIPVATGLLSMYDELNNGSS